MQKEENDTLITDNKKLNHWRRLDANDQFGGPECRSGDTPSTVRLKKEEHSRCYQRKVTPKVNEEERQDPILMLIFDT